MNVNWENIVKLRDEDYSYKNMVEEEHIII